MPRPTLPSRDEALELLFVDQLKALPDHDTRAVRENFLSSCFAGGLNASQSLARRVTRRLVGADTWKGMRISAASIAAASQIPHRSPGAKKDDCRIDLVLDVNKRRRVGVEVKLEAREGIDAEGRRQLQRYVSLPDLDAVAFVTADAETIASDLWKDHGGRRYLAPRLQTSGFVRRHFVWGDFYDDVVHAAQTRHASPVVVALKGLMDHLHLQPVHPLVGELAGRVAFTDASAAVQANRLRIQSAMRHALPILAEGGWSTPKNAPRNNGTVYTWRTVDDIPGLWNIWASTNLTPGAFRIWVNAANRKSASRLYSDLPDALGKSLQQTFGRDIRPHVLPAFDAEHPSVDCRLSLRRLLAGVRKQESVGPQLAKALRAAADATAAVLRT